MQILAVEPDLRATLKEDLDPEGLQKAFRFAACASLALLVIMIILIPLPLFFAQTVYGVGGFTAWVVIGIIWTFLSAFTVVLYPLWESRAALKMITSGMVKVCNTSACAEKGYLYSFDCRMSLVAVVENMLRPGLTPPDINIRDA